MLGEVLVPFRYRVHLQQVTTVSGAGNVVHLGQGHSPRHDYNSRRWCSIHTNRRVNGWYDADGSGTVTSPWRRHPVTGVTTSLSLW